MANTDAATPAGGCLGMYTWMIREPSLLGGNDHVWSRQTAMGVNEDDAFREIVERFPNANEVRPATYKEVKDPPAPYVVCNSMHQDAKEPWCRECGQNKEHHPIFSNSPHASDAIRWMEIVEREGSAYGGYGTD